MITAQGQQQLTVMKNKENITVIQPRNYDFQLH
jgi:hypothetical protein